MFTYTDWASQNLEMLTKKKNSPGDSIYCFKKNQTKNAHLHAKSNGGIK